MGKDYIPTKDADFLAWAGNASTLISANPTSYGVTAGIATILAGYYSSFADALATATNPSTRGNSTILAKDTAREILESYCRDVAMQIQGTMTVTDQQKFDLGLNVKQPPTPIQAPTEPPFVEEEERLGTWMRLRIHDGSGSRRSKPEGVQGARVYTYTGTVNPPPLDLNVWEFQGQATRSFVDLEFPDLAAGATVYVTAQWYTARGLTSPACAAVPVVIAGGAMNEAA